jgi:hypothetical protein
MQRPKWNLVFCAASLADLKMFSNYFLSLFSLLQLFFSEGHILKISSWHFKSDWNVSFQAEELYKFVDCLSPPNSVIVMGLPIRGLKVYLGLYLPILKHHPIPGPDSISRSQAETLPLDNATRTTLKFMMHMLLMSSQ